MSQVPDVLPALLHLLRNFSNTLPETFPADTYLGSRGLGLDSIALAELLLQVEERFAVDISPLLDGQDLTVGRVAEFVGSASRTQ